MGDYRSKYKIFYLQSYEGSYDIVKEDFIKYSQMLFKEDKRTLYLMQEELMAVYTHSCFENIIDIRDMSLIIILRVVKLELLIWFCVSHNCCAGLDNILKKANSAKVFATENSDKIVSVEMLNVYEKHRVRIKKLTCPFHFITLPADLLERLLNKCLIEDSVIKEINRLSKRAYIDENKLLLLKQL